MRVVYRREAAQEVADARQWYEDQRPGLGVSFTDAIHGVELIIGRHAEAFPKVHRDIRRALVPRYPFAIYYQPLDAATLEIVACLHTRRRPRAWRSRADDA